jgi:hypothetical protein
MRLMILCMLKINELKMLLKEIVVFFVLKLLEIVSPAYKHFKYLIYGYLTCRPVDFQFSVSGSGFSVLAQLPAHFNSLYPASDSLKN